MDTLKIKSSNSGKAYEVMARLISKYNERHTEKELDEIKAITKKLKDISKGELFNR